MTAHSISFFSDLATEVLNVPITDYSLTLHDDRFFRLENFMLSSQASSAFFWDTLRLQVESEDSRSVLVLVDQMLVEVGTIFKDPTID